MFCLDCAAAGALCGLCLAHGHRAIQICRSTYSSVVRASDLRGLVDVGGVQTYVINGARVVFLNERGPQHKHKHPGGASLCEACGRGRGLDVFHFCSLGCKVAAGCSCSSDGNASSSSLCNAIDLSSTQPPPPPLPCRRSGARAFHTGYHSAATSSTTSQC